MEEEFEKCNIAFELMQKKRMEARKKFAIVQNEFEAIPKLEDEKHHMNGQVVKIWTSMDVKESTGIGSALFPCSSISLLPNTFLRSFIQLLMVTGYGFCGGHFEVIIGQPRREQNLVASMKEKHEQGSQGDDATRKAAMTLKEIEKEDVRRHTSQLPTAPTSTNLKSVTSSVVSQVEGSKSGPSTLSAKETTKGIDENATATYKSPMAIPFMRALVIKEIGDHSSIQEEVKSEKPIKTTLPQVIPSLHYQSQTRAAGSSSPILEIGEIFQLVELKDGEPALLAKALEQGQSNFP
ncbi:hypothetical protein K1719_042555 [Acacia pycnantha]|nr:hypothetical protein K1719_042555 [Acacia pycnantha]